MMGGRASKDKKKNGKKNAAEEDPYGQVGEYEESPEGKDPGDAGPRTTASPTLSPQIADRKAYYVALWDYKSDTKAKLSLKMGDRVRLLEDGGQGAGPDWLFVTRAGEKCGTGYVPRSYVAVEGTLDAEPWYFGMLNRHEAEDVLRAGPEGAFIVRDRGDFRRSKSGPAEPAFTLSVKKKGGLIRHYQIWRLGERNGGGYFLSTKRKFATLIDLINWHKRDKSAENVDMVEPAKRKPPPRVPLSSDAQKQWREIPRSQIVLGKQVGKGNFGIVYKGTWQEPGHCSSKKVAIKALKAGSAGARHQFMKEAVAMKNLCHKNLVQLYGVVSTEEPYWLVQEFVKDGSLLKYLRARKQRSAELPERTLAGICFQVTSGMRYLEEKHLVHRDLAARNILVDADPKTDRILIKIADFGLAKLIDSKSTTDGRKRVREIPTKWTAPEALDKGRYSSESDVWSFGIVIHEVYTHGKEPYEMYNNAFVRRYVVQNRQILRRDLRVPEKVYDNIMTKCFKYDPAQRPTFKELYDMFNNYFGVPLEKESSTQVCATVRNHATVSSATSYRKVVLKVPYKKT